MKINSKRNSAYGFALPALVIIGAVVLTTGLTLIQRTTAIKLSLDQNYYERIARNTARSGLKYAKTCLGQAATWTELRPDTDCSGTAGTGRPYLVDTAAMRTQFTVQAPVSSGTANVIRSTGTVEVKNSTGSVIRTHRYTATLNASLNGTSAQNPPSAISVGNNHTCAISDGQALCWGRNTYGQLGDGTSATRETPTKVDTSGVLSGKAVTAISAGYNVTCAIADGRAYCWGEGLNGLIGNGAHTDQYSPTAVNTSGVLSGKTVTDVAVGFNHVCVIADGKPYCWGSNSLGQLGIGTTSGTYTTPVQVSDGATSGLVYTEIAAGSSFTCGIANSAPYCWGYNNDGRVGDGSNTNRLTPVAVSSSGVLSGKASSGLSTGSRSAHACVTANGQAYCWGLNSNGGLGNGSTTNSNVPVAVTTSGAFSGKTVTRMSLGNSHTCAIANGQPFCWGRNTYGQLGDGTTTQSTTPTLVSQTTGLTGKATVDIAANGSTSCAVAGGSLYCWGYGSYYQLGNGSYSNQTSPSAVQGMSGGGRTDISTGQDHTCAIDNGKAYCWGRNFYGQLGDGTNIDSFTPVAVDTSGVLNGRTVTKIATSNNHTCALADGWVYCWGYNFSQQLGDGTTVNRNVPVAVTRATGMAGIAATDITAGGSHSCLVANGAGYCWGSNNYGQAGNGSTLTTTGPVPVTTGARRDVLTGKSLVAISAGDRFTCAIANGAAYCWGMGTGGRLGTGTTTDSDVPVAVSTATGLSGKALSYINSGVFHTCVIAGGGAYCWGSNSSGQLGDGTTMDRLSPVPVSTSGALNGGIISNIDGGHIHTCAVASGRVYCWGSAQVGRLGDGTTSTTNRTLPVAVDTTGSIGNSAILTVTAGYRNGCVVTNSSLHCWGSGLYGVNGDGTGTTRPSPVQVIGNQDDGGSGETSNQSIIYF